MNKLSFLADFKNLSRIQTDSVCFEEPQYLRDKHNYIFEWGS